MKPGHRITYLLLTAFLLFTSQVGAVETQQGQITDLDELLPAIWMDENLVKQVLMNMLVNAQHAITEEGVITIKTRLCAGKDCPECTIGNENMVVVSIKDTGCGIPEEDLQKIFDPFFTTKDVGKGTGLGLSVSHGTIEAHGGAIEVESTVGSGSEFRIYLPATGNDDQGTDA